MRVPVNPNSTAALDQWLTLANTPPGLTLFPISPDRSGIPTLLSERFRRSKRSRLQPTNPPLAPINDTLPAQQQIQLTHNSQQLCRSEHNDATPHAKNALPKKATNDTRPHGKKQSLVLPLAPIVNITSSDNAMERKSASTARPSARQSTVLKPPALRSDRTPHPTIHRNARRPNGGFGSGSGGGVGANIGGGGLSALDDITGGAPNLARADSPSNDAISSSVNNNGVGSGSGQGLGSAPVDGRSRRGGGGKASIDKDGEDKDSGLVPLEPEELYKPFPLSVKSSFNPSRISERQLKKMDRLTRAKYGAYEAPEPQVSQNIDHSRARAKHWNKENHRALRLQIEEIRRIWKRRRGYLDDEEEQRGQEAAKKAMERMKGKLKSIIMSRENELQFLVEGQKNAIDAIRTKEFLVLRPHDAKLGRQYSEKDRLRVEELLLLSGASIGKLVRPGMPNYALNLRADLENISNIRPKDSDYEWTFQVKCGNCHELRDGPLMFNAVEEVELKNSRGTANISVKCKFCSSDSNATIIKNSLKPYTSSGEWQTILLIESRGLEFVGCVPSNKALWSGSSTESSELFDIDFEDDENSWVGYDESGKCPVGVTDLTFSFNKKM